MKIGIDLLLDNKKMTSIDFEIDIENLKNFCSEERQRIIQEKIDEFIANKFDWKWFYKKKN